MLLGEEILPYIVRNKIKDQRGMGIGRCRLGSHDGGPVYRFDP